MKHCAGTQAARRAVSPKTTRDARNGSRRTQRAAASMSVLRRPNVHHRDLRARLRAHAPPHARSGGDQDRHLMTPSPSIHDRSDAHYSCWLSAGSAQARIGALDSPAAPPSLVLCAQIARSNRRTRPSLLANRSQQSLQFKLRTPSPLAKSP